MKRHLIVAATALVAMSAPAFAEGDTAKGEKAFKKCKACHMIKDDAGEVIFKGGKTGPNLYGVIGRAAGSQDFKYGKSMASAGEAGLVWDEANLAAFIKDPKAFLIEATGDSGARSKMSFKMKKGGDDVAAYLATFSPAPAEEMAEEPAEDAAASE